MSTRPAPPRFAASQARLFAAAGVDKIRLTGGEPTLRPDLVDITAGLSALPGVKAVGLTSNGLTLGRKLPALKDAGAAARGGGAQQQGGGVHGGGAGEAPWLHRSVCTHPHCWRSHSSLGLPHAFPAWRGRPLPTHTRCSMAGAKRRVWWRPASSALGPSPAPLQACPC